VNILRPTARFALSAHLWVKSGFRLLPCSEGQKSIGGSAVGSNAEIRAMFQFSAQHAITPRTEAFAMREVNEALDRLRQNHARYRAVLINDS
jgi:uncharacterized zinc-type alcohol dehydrogenase-like protein